MDDAAAELFHLLQRLLEVVHGKVGQRRGVAGATAALMDANGGTCAVGLPAVSFVVSAFTERYAKKG